MQNKKEQTWYAPLHAYFSTISGSMPLKKFAEIEAMLHLLTQNEPKADPEKAYLLLCGYQLIGTTACSELDHQLQCARDRLGYYRSRKFWQDAYCQYRDDKYQAYRAFEFVAQDGIVQVRKRASGYPHSYDKRLSEWAYFWSAPKEPHKELPVAANGRYTYRYQKALDSEQASVHLGNIGTISKTQEPVNPKGIREPIRISMDTLLESARQMQQLDPKDYCYPVLQQNVLKAVTDGAVSVGAGLDIQQVVNIVGMVGSGKSTLIKVLAFWASKNNRRAVIVVDTVAEVLNLWQYLHKLNVDCSPLIGRSERLKYINQITVPEKTCLSKELSQLLTGSCLIDGMDETREAAIVFGKEPCYILKKGSYHLCPYFDVCSGSKMLRACMKKSVVIRPY